MRGAASPRFGWRRRATTRSGAIQLATSIVFGVLVSFGLGDDKPSAGGRSALHSMAAFQFVDTLFILGGLFLIPRPRAFEPLMKPAIAWIVAVPAILAAFLANHWYHAAMRVVLHARSEPDLILAGAGLTPFVFAVYCIQPAIVEELFFRHLALDSLRAVMSPTAAVLVSSLMFGLAHLGVPLSIPVLGLVGVVLGWARVASGSLALPMLLHALHNFLVIV
jgi:uncharacterized protein